MIHRAELRVKRSDACGHGLAFWSLGQHHSPEIIIPDKGKYQHRKRRKGGLHQGQDHIPENADFRDAFDARRLDQLKRQGADKVTHEERAKPGLKRDMEQDQTGFGVV